MTSIEEQLSQYPVGLVNACNAALDLGLFYETDFKAYVFKNYSFDVTPKNLIPGEPELLKTRDDDSQAWDEYRAFTKEVATTLKHAPAGSYLVHCHDNGYSQTYQGVMCDGRGRISTLPNTERAPSEQEMFEYVFGYNIYVVRKLLEEQRRIAEDHAALKTNAWAVGFRAKNIFVGTNKYSTAEITFINVETASVSLRLTKRGSSKRWETSMRAADFAHAIAQSKQLEGAKAANKTQFTIDMDSHGRSCVTAV